MTCAFDPKSSTGADGGVAAAAMMLLMLRALGRPGKRPGPGRSPSPWLAVDASGSVDLHGALSSLQRRGLCGRPFPRRRRCCRPIPGAVRNQIDRGFAMFSMGPDRQPTGPRSCPGRQIKDAGPSAQTPWRPLIETTHRAALFRRRHLDLGRHRLCDALVSPRSPFKGRSGASSIFRVDGLNKWRPFGSGRARADEAVGRPMSNINGPADPWPGSPYLGPILQRRNVIGGPRRVHGS